MPAAALGYSFKIIRPLVLALSLILFGVGGLASGGEVMPPGASPQGYSLADMARKLALFDTSNNASQTYPDTPFAILFQDAAKESLTITTCPDTKSGLLLLGGNTFAVPTGKPFFVPLFSADDSAPVVGNFPAQEAGAIGYFFGASQLGARDFEIIVDGQITAVGPAYIAGPVQVAALGDGNGTHLIQLGLFLTPFSPGTHTITIRGQLAGAAILPAAGISCLQEDFTYVVKVTPARGSDELP